MSSQPEPAPDHTFTRVRAPSSPLGTPQGIGGRMRRRFGPLDRLATWGETEARLLNVKPILVFSLGKTGTSSLEDGLRASTRRPVVKAHNLSRQGLRRRIKQERRSGNSRPHFLWRSEAMRADMLLRRARRWDVISVMRDPLARSVSAYFYSQRASGDPVPTDPDYHGPRVEAFARRLHVLPDWFSAELEPVTGIDAYAVPYPFDVGVLATTAGRWRSYVTRTEDLPMSGPRIIEYITEQETASLPRSNAQSADPAYTEFLASWRFDPGLCEELFSSRAVRHFYRPTEVNQMHERWCR